jgi:hypothetical protein
MIRNPRAQSQPLVSAGFFCLAGAHTLRHPPPRTPPMASNDPLTIFEEPNGLRQPVLILAFSGWNDAAESATTAARYLGQIWPSEPLATIDPEEFYHFGLSRPHCASRRAHEVSGRSCGRRPTSPSPGMPPSTAISSSGWPPSRTSAGAPIAERFSISPGASRPPSSSPSGPSSPKCRTPGR